MTALALIGIWLSVSIIAGLLIGRGIKSLRSAESEMRGPQVMPPVMSTSLWQLQLHQ